MTTSLVQMQAYYHLSLIIQQLEASLTVQCYCFVAFAIEQTLFWALSLFGSCLAKSRNICRVHRLFATLSLLIKRGISLHQPEIKLRLINIQICTLYKDRMELKYYYFLNVEFLRNISTETTIIVLAM